MFKQFTNKPKIITAVQFTNENKDQVFNRLTGQYTPDFDNGSPIILLTTINGDIATVRIGDWIVKEHVEGYYYPVKAEIFNNSYEEV